MTSYPFIKAINPDRLTSEIIAAGLVGLDHIDSVGTDVTIWFTDPLSQLDEALLTTTVTAHEAVITEDQVKTAISVAITFGTELLADFAVENVMLGITASGKLPTLINYLHWLGHCIVTGSLHSAVTELDALIADVSLTKLELAPFVTNARLITYKHRIQTFLGDPLT